MAATMVADRAVDTRAVNRVPNPFPLTMAGMLAALGPQAINFGISIGGGEAYLLPNVSGLRGPFALHLAVEENRLNMDIRSLAHGSPARGAGETVVLPLAPFRRIVKDYFLICESYYKAIRDRGVAQVEAIDAGRRALHDEGAELLTERLAGKVAIDHATARRLFTLLCVLHLRA